MTAGSVRDASLFDQIKVVVFGHFWKVSILFENGQSPAEEVQRLVADQLAAIKPNSINPLR